MTGGPPLAQGPQRAPALRPAREHTTAWAGGGRGVLAWPPELQELLCTSHLVPVTLSYKPDWTKTGGDTFAP